MFASSLSAFFFSRSCVYLPNCAVRKCNNLRDHGHAYKFPDWWPPNSHGLIQLTIKSGATCLSDKSAECERFEAATDWCLSWSGTERYRWWHWPVTYMFPWQQSSYRRTLGLSCSAATNLEIYVDEHDLILLDYCTFGLQAVNDAQFGRVDTAWGKDAKSCGIYQKMKKRSEATQTLRADCRRRSQKFPPRRRPPSRGRGTAKI